MVSEGGLQPHVAVLASHPLFSALRSEDLIRLSESAAVVAYAPGTSVFAKGQPGDAAYVVISGYVQIFIPGYERLVVLAKLGPSDLFGEEALVTGAPRSASARAFSAVLLLRIDRETFVDLLQRCRALREELRALVQERQAARLISSSLVLQRLVADDVGGTSPTEKHIAAGEVVITEGEEPDGIYWILSGEADVYRTVAGVQLSLCTIGQGHCFGERAILEGTKRSASVRAKTDLRALFVPADRFLRLHRRDPDVSTYFAHVLRSLALPKLGLVTQFAGLSVGGEETIFSQHELTDGRVFLAALTPRTNVFSLERLPAGQMPADVRVLSFAAGDVRRTIALSAGGIPLRIVSDGYWSDLPELLVETLRGVGLDEELLAEFGRTGSLAKKAGRDVDPSDGHIVCRCIGVSVRVIRRAFAEGATSVSSLQRDLGCGTVCGACNPTIAELIGGEAWTHATLSDTVRLTDSVRAFRLVPPGKCSPSRPGQHVVVRARIGGDVVQRPYTLTSTGEPGEPYEITVKREPRGVLSSWLFDHTEERITVEISRPQGGFFWDIDRGSDVVCMVAGIGVTPAIAMLRAKLRRDVPGRLLIHYSVRDGSKAAFRDELRTIPEERGITVRIWETGTHGRLGDDVLRGLVTEFSTAQFFVCGPEQYNRDIASRLRELGVPTEAVNVEVFRHQGDPVTSSRPTADPVPPAALRRLPFLGNYQAYGTPMLLFALSQYPQLGPIFNVKLWYRTVTYMAGPEANAFFGEHPECFSQERTFAFMNKGLATAQHIMAVDGEAHASVRHAIEPLLDPARFRGTLSRQCVAAIDEFARRLVVGQSLSADDLTVLTTSLSCAALLGRTLPLEEASIGVALRRTFHEEYAFFFPAYLPWLPLTTYRRSAAHRLADRLLDEAGASPDGLAYRLYRADRPLTMDALRAAILIPLMVGNGSLASTLEWLLFCILRDPELLLEAKREARAGLEEEELAMDDLSRTPCLRAAALEAVRRFPFFPGIACTATREFAFEGRRVSRGQYLLVCTPVTNFLSEFFEDPFAFRWQRFLAGTVPPPRMPSWTFGGGPHACPSRTMAPSFLVLMAARLLRRFDFDVAFRDIKYQPRPFMRLRGRPIRVRCPAP